MMANVNLYPKLSEEKLNEGVLLCRNTTLTTREHRRKLIDWITDIDDYTASNLSRNQLILKVQRFIQANRTGKAVDQSEIVLKKWKRKKKKKVNKSTKMPINSAKIFTNNALEPKLTEQTVFEYHTQCAEHALKEIAEQSIIIQKAMFQTALFHLQQAEIQLRESN